jgi:site-specific DNA recombinase
MTTTPKVRCAIYTRKSSEEGLEMSFNSLDAQREACESYIKSQRHEGWQVVPTKYDDGGFSGGNMQRPALNKLLEDIAAKRIDTVVVYKVDRLTRSLADFAKIVEQFDQQGVSFVSVTQQFNTTSSMGRLTLNVLLSFAQFEREVTGERIRDKIAASKRKGMWMGGVIPTGYDVHDRQLIVNEIEAAQIREIYRLYLDLGCVSKLQEHLEKSGIRSKKRVSQTGRLSGGAVYSRGALYELLQNRLYLGEIAHKGACYKGEHSAIVDREVWDQVQAQLKGNLQSPRKRPRVTEQSLLTGLLYGARGNRFTPSHSSKKGTRYRYYVSQTVIRKANKQSADPVRLPAKEIEDLVISQFKSFLNSPQQLLGQLWEGGYTASEMQGVIVWSQEQSTASTEQIAALFKGLVGRVTVHEDAINLHLSRSSFRRVVNGAAATAQMSDMGSEEPAVIKVETRLKRFGTGTRFVMPPDDGPGKRHEVPALIKAIARAHDWVDQIVSGKVLSQRALATETGF